LAQIEGQLSRLSSEALINQHWKPEQTQNVRLDGVQRGEVVEICAIVAKRYPGNVGRPNINRTWNDSMTTET